jgi:hypothetical protein
MSFSIKCDKCGHVVKFVKSTKRHNCKIERPITISFKNDNNKSDVTVMKCSVCGHEQKEI